MRQNFQAECYGNDIITRSMQIKAESNAEQSGMNMDANKYMHKCVRLAQYLRLRY